MEGSLLIDTGAFIALQDSHDDLHEDAKVFYYNLSSAVRRITTQAVVSECYTFFRYRFNSAAAARWLDYLDNARNSNHLRVIYNDELDSRRAEEFLRRFDDQVLSYTDSLTLASAERHKVRAIFSFDHHLALTGLPLLPGRLARR
ncbi:MAG TPA: PIN domain-containing protein [Candidatus Baltobacteraceae bacterium]|jgi:predicted nucleic acid-binding protein|nr:PIN domain-containing protein [Candidatus Baltobacteraceae bacterium]